MAEEIWKWTETTRVMILIWGTSYLYFLNFDYTSSKTLILYLVSLTSAPGVLVNIFHYFSNEKSWVAKGKVGNFI